MKKAYICTYLYISGVSGVQITTAWALDLQPPHTHSSSTHTHHRVEDCLEVRTLTNLWQQQQRSTPVITDESIHILYVAEAAVRRKSSCAAAAPWVGHKHPWFAYIKVPPMPLGGIIIGAIIRIDGHEAHLMIAAAEFLRYDTLEFCKILEEFSHLLHAGASERAFFRWSTKNFPLHIS